MRKASASCAAIVLTACVSLPTTGPTGGAANGAMANTTAQMEMQNANMMAAQSAAQANAIRPGDDSLSCEALQPEMKVMFNDPAFVAAISSMGASAQSQIDRANAARTGAAGLAATTTVAGIAGSMISGIGWLGSAAVQTRQAAALSQMSAANKNRTQMM